MASSQEGASRRPVNVKVLVSESSKPRIGIGWQEILAVLFGILGGGAYCIFTKQPAIKKALVLLTACSLRLAAAHLPLQEQTLEPEKNQSQEEVLESSPSSSFSSSTTDSPSSLTPSLSQSEEADCSYGVCTRTYTAENGDSDIYSTGYGESYDVHSRSYESDGETAVRSWDSEGNSYSVNSSCDSTGCHSSDSEGNQCSILSDGTTIGCN